MNGDDFMSSSEYEKYDKDTLPVPMNLYWIHQLFYQSPFSSCLMFKNFFNVDYEPCVYRRKLGVYLFSPPFVCLCEMRALFHDTVDI